jgi:hypothetical protein
LTYFVKYASLSSLKTCLVNFSKLHFVPLNSKMGERPTVK